jgi:cytochrome c556
MHANAEAWFKDTDKEVEILKTQAKETIWENADGEKGQIDMTSLIKKIDKDYKKLKANIRDRFK